MRHQWLVITHQLILDNERIKKKVNNILKKKEKWQEQILICCFRPDVTSVT